MFQSPQWGNNSKGQKTRAYALAILMAMFQSPQWGNNSKDSDEFNDLRNQFGFSPRNGEIILKKPMHESRQVRPRFSPRNGEIILKGTP